MPKSSKVVKSTAKGRGRLSGYLTDLRRGRATESEDEIQLMKDLVTQHSRSSVPPDSSKQLNGIAEASKVDHGGTDEPRGEHIASSSLVLRSFLNHVIRKIVLMYQQLLTGATGALGAHILHLLRSISSVSHITCLVRASSPFAAHERVSKSVTARAKPGLPPFSQTPPTTGPSSEAQFISPAAKPTVTCLPCTLSDPTLGIPSEIYAHLASSITVIIHAAWAVNFTARLRSFEKDHIAGLSHLLRLSNAVPKRAEPIRFLFLSSTASVTNTPATNYPIPERVSSNPEEASPLGYSRSKWVAENICNAFHSRASSTSSQNQDTNNSNDEDNESHTNIKSNHFPNLAILRIGQLTSDTLAGIWNMSEAWPLMLSTAPILHALPNLQTQALDWLPVDIAAQAVLQTAESMKTHNGGRRGAGCPVFHILNPCTTPTWSDLLKCIRKESPSLDLEVLAPREWLRRLDEFEGELPAKKLVGLWKGASVEGNDDGEESPRISFDVTRSKEVSATMRDVGPLDEGFLGRMWRWVEMQTARDDVGKFEGRSD
ncbi:MAG: hypothetical protein Q9171_001536 [Xanthocarpia ochracea]